MPETLDLSPEWARKLEPFLPRRGTPSSSSTPSSPEDRPFTTLTFATSLDAGLSLAPGLRTRLSGPDSKAMTHYLRSRHDAILVGIGTLLADDPALNCRIAGAPSQPRPVIVDPRGRWAPTREDKVLQVCRDGAGQAPFVITAAVASGDGARDASEASRAVLAAHGGKYINVPATPSGPEGRPRFAWRDIMTALRREGLTSVMVEGGGQLINSLLDPASHGLVDSVIVTIAPVWLGRGAVTVSPDRVTDGEGTALPVARLSGVAWHPFGEDVVLCGRLHG